MFKHAALGLDRPAGAEAAALITWLFGPNMTCYNKNISVQHKNSRLSKANLLNMSYSDPIWCADYVWQLYQQKAVQVMWQVQLLDSLGSEIAYKTNNAPADSQDWRASWFRAGC